MKIYAIEVDENCRIAVGEIVHVDHDTTQGAYKGDFKVSAIEIDTQGRVEVEIMNDKTDESVWLPITAVEF
tara:strand:- start:9 stop:221 length:213 start_codon:yes stop_codon:yes gene_type:complete